MSTYTDASLIITPNAKKAGKLYALKGTDLDVVRATTATYVGGDGLIKTALANEPRFDYTNGSCPSILVEPQRTNLLLRSEEFDNAYWNKLASSISVNETTSPSGNLTADKLVEDTSGSAHRFISTSFSTINGVSYTISIFLKKAGRDYAYIRLNNSGGDIIAANINLLNGTVSQSVFGSVTIVPHNDNWYRIIATGTSISTSNGSFEVRTSNSATYANYTGNGTSGIFIWGAQLEAGANATSYIPTVASTVTRNADVISKTGISDLIGQTEGIMYVEIAPLTIESTSRDIEISDGNTNRVIIQFNNTGISALVIVGGVVQASLNFNNSDTDFKKVALKYKVNDFALFVNGVKIAFDTSGATFPANTLTRLDFKKVTPSSLEYYGKVKSLCLWKTALTDQQCIELTTL